MSDNIKDKMDKGDKRTDDNLRLNFSQFLKNDHQAFTVLKSEKLAAAVHTITSFMSDIEPLRTRLRSSALDLVSCTADRTKAHQYGGHVGFGARCLEIGTLLQTAERAGLVSPMNAQILCEEYASLASFVGNHAERVFSINGLDVAAPLPPASPAKLPGGLRKPSLPATTHTQFKKTNNYKRHKNRRETILSLFNKKDKISVKDASDSIEGCSEKTIQRELIAMVEEGVLLKEGKRRWSFYRKASPNT